MCASIHTCVCVSVRACMHLCMFLHASVHTIMCSAQPEVAAVLDGYGPEAGPAYWQRGWVEVAGLQIARNQGGKLLGHPPEKNWDFRPSYTSIIIITVISVGSHCQGIVTFYPPISLSCIIFLMQFMCISSLLYIKHARSSNLYFYIHARAIKKLVNVHFKGLGTTEK